MPTEELRRICEWARSHGIRVHMDGARLWEAVAAGAGRLDEICKLPDSVNLCLTKGIGASVGSVLAGDESFMERALWIRQSVGGSMRQPGFVAAAAYAAISDVFGSNPDGSESFALKKAQAQAGRLATKWQQLGGKLTVPQQTNILWLDLDHAGIEEQEWEAQGERYGLKIRGSRIIVHYQILQSNVKKLEELMEHMLAKSGRRKPINRPMQIIKGSVSRVAASMKEVYARAG